MNRMLSRRLKSTGTGTHGTRIQIEFKSTLAARKRLIEYLKYTSIVNPHARIRLEMDDETFLFDTGQ